VQRNGNLSRQLKWAVSQREMKSLDRVGNLSHDNPMKCALNSPMTDYWVPLNTSVCAPPCV
jgi:hypothetical protein